MTESMNDKGVCRTSPATPGLLNIYVKLNFYLLPRFIVQCNVIKETRAKRGAALKTPLEQLIVI